MPAYAVKAQWFAVLAIAGLILSGAAAGEVRGGAGEARVGAGPLTIKVEIEGVTQGLFDVVEGLESRSEVLAPEDGTDLPPSPGPLHLGSLVLKRPYDPALSGLWNWRRTVVEGVPQRRDGRILLFDARGRMVACWVFSRGWPSRWEVSSLRSGESVPGTEIIEIVHEGLSLED